jgi:hypothetical protein
MRFDEIDGQCPECDGDATCGGCVCDGGDLMKCGVERSVEFSEAGRAKTGRTLAGPGASSAHAKRGSSFRPHR